MSRQKYCKEKFQTVPVVIYSIKDFYLLDALNRKIEMLKNTGLIDFWHFQDIDERFLYAKASKRPRVMRLRNLLGCFHILGAGCVISLIVFFIEVFSSSSFVV